MGARGLSGRLLIGALVTACMATPGGTASAGVTPRAGTSTSGAPAVTAPAVIPATPGRPPAMLRGTAATSGTEAAPGGRTAATLQTQAVLPAAAALSTGDFTPVSPARTLDTRAGIGAPRVRIAAGRAVTVTVAGRTGVPATGVGAVLLTVTSILPATPGYLSVYPTGVARPSTVSLNFATGQTISNLVVAKVSTSGQVTVFTSATTDLIADVHGWYATTSTMHAVTPARLLDTRSGVGAPAGTLATNRAVDVQVTGRGGVPPTGATGVVVNLTGIGSPTAGSMTVFPSGTSAPGAALNLPARTALSNLAFVRLGTGGKLTVLNRAGAAHAVLDVVAWQAAGGQYHPVGPERRYDTRAPGATGSIVSGGWLDLWMTGFGTVPSVGVHAVVLNVTVVNPTANGSVLVHQQGLPRPAALSLTYVKGRTSTSQVVAFIGAGGWIRFNNTGSAVNFVVDTIGWYSADGTVGLAPGQGLTLPGAGVTYLAISGVSPDGRYVFFVAREVLSPYAAGFNIYVRDVLLGLTQVMVSGAYSPEWVRVSADGRRITWESTDARLWNEPPSLTNDVFWYDITTNDFRLVSGTPAGVPGRGNSGGAEISADGRYVGFKSDAPGLAPGQTAGLNSLIRDMVTGTTRRIGPCSGSPNGFSCIFAVSADGGTVLLRTDQPDGTVRPMVWRRGTGAITLVSQIEQNDEVQGMSADGNTVVFLSAGVFPPALGLRWAFRALNLSTGALTVLNDRPDGQVGEGTGNLSTISSDGSTVAFGTQSDLSSNGPQAFIPSQVYATDPQGGPVTSVSRNPAGQLGDGGSFPSVLSRTGSYLVWGTEATNLGFPLPSTSALRLHRLK